MANTEIDSLSLDITINGLNDKDVKNLESLANSIAKLQRNLKKLELNKLQEINIPQNLKGIEGVQITPIQSSDLTNQVSQFQEEFSKNFDFSEEYGELFKDVENSSQEVFTTFEQLDSKAKNLEGTVGKVNTDMKALKGSTKQVSDETDKTNKNLKKPKKQLNEIEKQLKRIKTIGLVKLIRGAMQGFIRGMQEGTKNLAQFDSSFNETMSSMATAKTQIFNSLILIAEPLITTIAPIITNISSAVQEVGNTVSMISASMKGMTSYTRTNAKYMEDYANASKNASRFSFDTFETLNDTGKSDMYETVEIDDTELSSYEDLFSIVNDVKESFGDVKEIISEIGGYLKGFIGDNIGNIKEIFSQSKEFTDTIKDVFSKINFEKLLKAVSKVITDIVNNTGIVLNLVEGILENLSPLIDVIISDLLPALLEIVSDSMNPIFEILQAISPIITTIVGLISNVLTPILKIISPIISTIGSMVSRIGEGIAFIVENYLTTKIVSALNTLNTLLEPIVTVVSWLLNSVGEIFNMIDSLLHGNWNGFIESFGRAVASIGVTILKFFAGVIDFIINGVIEAINFVLTPLRETIKAFGGEFNGITWRSNLVGSVPSYANGGVVGEIWQMNEYGNPEMLYNSNNGSTAVITQDQLAMAFQEAIFNTGLLDAISETKGVYIDGKYIAQSKNFKQELNRTNPGLNIK